MNMKRIILIIAGIATFSAFSCSKKPDTGGTAAEKFANEWYVTLYKAGTPGPSHAHMYTYNTSANSNEIWLDDDGNVYEFKFKATVDLGSLTFSASNVTNQWPSYPIKINVTDGKIIPDAGRSKTGNVTDSIYMKITFSDDPGVNYELKGHARTRFSEDDY